MLGDDKYFADKQYELDVYRGAGQLIAKEGFLECPVEISHLEILTIMSVAA